MSSTCVLGIFFTWLAALERFYTNYQSALFDVTFHAGKKQKCAEKQAQHIDDA